MKLKPYNEGKEDKIILKDNTPERQILCVFFHLESRFKKRWKEGIIWTEEGATGDRQREQEVTVVSHQAALYTYTIYIYIITIMTLVS